MTSNSDSSTGKNDRKQIKFEISSRPNSDFLHGCGTKATIEPEHDKEEEPEQTESTASSYSSSSDVKPPSLGGIEVSENDDGFKTPTSLDHKIPEITECPPAPRKQRPRESRKRKASPRIRRILQLDFSEEVESMFPPPIQEDLGRKIKRSRTETRE